MNRFFSSLLPGPALLSVASGLFMLLLFALPIIFVPSAADAFVFPKQVIFSVVTVMLAALMIGAAAFGRELRLLLQPVNGFLFLLLLWMVTSVVWSSSTALAWIGVQRFFLFLLFVFLFQSLTIRNRTIVVGMIAALLCSFLVVAGWALIQDFRQAFTPHSVTVRPTLGDWRDSISLVGLGNTSHIADFLAFGFLCWVGALLLARRPWVKMLAVASLWLHAGGLIVCWSVHSNLSLIVASILLAWLLKDQIGSRIRRARIHCVALVLGWVFIVGFFVIDHPVNPHGSRVWSTAAAASFRAHGVEPPTEEFTGGIFSQAFASPRWTSGFSTRKAIWLTTLEMIRHNVVLGVGANNFTYVYPATVSEIVLHDPDLNRYSGAWTNAAHNDLMQAWAEYGIIGLFLFLAVIGATIRNYWQRLKRFPSAGTQAILAVGLCAFIALLLQSQMNFPLQLPVSTMLFFLLIALPMVLPRSGNEEPEMLVPVERPYGPVRVGIIMHNMAYPSEFRLRLMHGGILSVVTAGIALIAALLLSWQLLQPLQADIWYRRMRDARDAMDAGILRRDRVIGLAEKGLAVWPGHVDMRANWVEQLLRAGRYDEVVEQTPIVLEKLNAIEVYTRRGEALEALGRKQEASADFSEAARRKGFQ